MPSFLQSTVLLLLSTLSLVRAQSVTSSASGYAGYSLGVTGDSDSAIYETENTDTTNSSVTNPPPDVFLNASLSVGEIDITVSNLSAKVNLDAQVLSLLTFNAGVDVSIAQVNLLIQNVTAQVLLEARLANLYTMISDVLDSIDLNPLIASAGSAVASIGNDTGSLVSSATSDLSARSFDYEVAHNILYSINDYSGNTHTNRILEQDGSIVDQYLNNDGTVLSQKVVGDYKTDMTVYGQSQEATVDGQQVDQVDYVYTPYNGFNVISQISFDAAGAVVGARVLSETSAGGTSTIGNDL